MSEIGSIAEHFDLWHHIDGAYGAFFILTPRGKYFKRNGTFDSLVMDPIKDYFFRTVPGGTC